MGEEQGVKKKKEIYRERKRKRESESGERRNADRERKKKKERTKTKPGIDVIKRFMNQDVHIKHRKLMMWELHVVGSK